MARYGTQIQQTPVDMYNPLNVKFYADILDKAQTNLTQGTAMQAKMLEDAYGVKHMDEATHKAQVAQVEQDIAGLTEADFVSPSNVIKGISKAGQKFAPYKALAERQVELSKNYEEDKRRLGLNFLGTDPTKISLTGDNGKLITPETLKYASMNAKDVYDAFGSTYGANLLGTREGRVKSDLDYYYKIEKTKGLSKEEKLALLSPGTKDAVELANGMMSTNPSLKEGLLSIYGDEKKASQALQELNLRASFDDKYAQTKDSEYKANDWGMYLAKRALETPPPEANPLFSVTKDDVIMPNQNLTLDGIVTSVTGKAPTTSFDKMQFDDNGEIVRTKVKEGRPIAGGRYGSSSSSGVAYKNENYMQEKLQLESLRLAYMKGAKNNYEMQKIKNMTPKELVETTRQASINAAAFYSSRGLVLNDNLAMQVASPFKDANGGFRDAKNANLQYYNEKNNTWVDTTPNEMADKFELTDDKSKQDLQTELSKVTTNTISFNDPKEVKMKASVNVGGKAIPVRFSPANTAIGEMFEPQRQVHQIVMTPGDHNLNFNGVNYKLNTTLKVSPNKAPELQTRVVNAKVSENLSKTPRPGQQISDYEAATREMEEVKNSYDQGTDLLGKTNQYAEGYGTNNNIFYRTENPKKGI